MGPERARKSHRHPGKRPVRLSRGPATHLLPGQRLPDAAHERRGRPGPGTLPDPASGRRPGRPGTGLHPDRCRQVQGSGRPAHQAAGGQARPGRRLSPGQNRRRPGAAQGSHPLPARGPRPGPDPHAGLGGSGLAAGTRGRHQGRRGLLPDHDVPRRGHHGNPGQARTPGHQAQGPGRRAQAPRCGRHGQVPAPRRHDRLHRGQVRQAGPPDPGHADGPGPQESGTTLLPGRTRLRGRKKSPRRLGYPGQGAPGQPQLRQGPRVSHPDRPGDRRDGHGPGARAPGPGALPGQQGIPGRGRGHPGQARPHRRGGRHPQAGRGQVVQRPRPALPLRRGPGKTQTPRRGYPGHGKNREPRPEKRRCPQLSRLFPGRGGTRPGQGPGHDQHGPGARARQSLLPRLPGLDSAQAQAVHRGPGHHPAGRLPQVTDAIIWEHYGDIAAAAGRKAEAVKAYRTALDLGSDTPDAVRKKLEGQL